MHLQIDAAAGLSFAILAAEKFGHAPESDQPIHRETKVILYRLGEF